MTRQKKEVNPFFFPKTVILHIVHTLCKKSPGYLLPGSATWNFRLKSGNPVPFGSSGIPTPTSMIGIHRFFVPGMGAFPPEIPDPEPPESGNLVVTAEQIVPQTMHIMQVEESHLIPIDKQEQATFSLSVRAPSPFTSTKISFASRRRQYFW